MNNIYLLNVNSGRTRKMCEVSLKSTIKIPEKVRCCVFVINVEHVSHLTAVFLVLNLNW